KELAAAKKELAGIESAGKKETPKYAAAQAAVAKSETAFAKAGKSYEKKREDYQAKKDQLAAMQKALDAMPVPGVKWKAPLKDSLSDLYAAAAEAILKQTGIKRGFCLVAGSEQGRLAFELAKRSELVIFGVEADERKVAAAREALAKAGLYGSRVTFDHLDLN